MSSTLTALRALDLVAERQPIGVSELARVMGIPKPNAQRALQALATGGWLRHAADRPGKWVLTAKAVDVAAKVGQNMGLREVALPVLTTLAHETAESAHLAVADGVEIVIIDEVPSTQVVRIHWPVGRRAPVYASANGKAFLSALPPDELGAHLPAELTPFTGETITDLDRLRTELGLIRARGYAVQCGELRSDVASVAAAICTEQGRPVAAVSVFLPTERFPADGGSDLGARVRRAAEQISGGIAGSHR